MDSLTGSPLMAILTFLMTIIGSAGLGGLFKTWLDHKRGARKQTDDVALALVQQLTERITRLEDQQVRERENCDNELRAMRHKLNNIDAAFDGVMFAIEATPENAKDIVAKAREARATQRQQEAQETAALLMGGKK